MTATRTKRTTRFPAATYVIAMPPTTQLQRMQALSMAAMHYVTTLTTGLYGPEDIEQARKRYLEAKNALSVTDLTGTDA